jgi:hypothetical protein
LLSKVSSSWPGIGFVAPLSESEPLFALDAKAPAASGAFALSTKRVATGSAHRRTRQHFRHSFMQYSYPAAGLVRLNVGGYQ